MVALCHSRQEAEQVKARLAEWLAPRGLTFNEEKTRIVHLDDGFDFLGFTARRFHGKLLIKPSKAAIKRVRQRLAVEFRALRGANVAAVLARINPITRGWANYYRGAASSIVFAALDAHLWRLTYKWACHSHPDKPKPWITNRYFGRYNPARQDRWVFGDRDSGAYLPKLAWTKIVRHRTGARRGVPGRPRPSRLLGPTASQEQTTARSQHPSPAAQAEGPLSDLRRPAPPRRPRATKPP